MTPPASPRVLVRSDPTGTSIGVADRLGRADSLAAPLDTVGIEQIRLPGMVALVDPACPWDPPRLVIQDPTAAADTVEELWGPRAADAVRESADGELEISDAGPALRHLVELGTARWLRRWQPYPVDAGLLELDLRIALDRCGHLVDSEEWTESLVPDLDASTVDRLVTQVDHALRIGQHPPQEGSGGTPSWVLGLGRPRALAAGVRPTQALAGTTTADWDRVPAATISRAESAVHWSVEGAELHVFTASAEQPERHPLTAGLYTGSRVGEPAPHDDASTPHSAELRVRPYVSGWPLPLAEGRLAPVGSTESWACTVPLSSRALHLVTQAGPRAVLIDIAAVAVATSPPTGRAAARSQARRWGVRSVAAARLAAALQHRDGRHRSSLSTQATASRRAAMTVWTSVGSPTHRAVLERWADFESLTEAPPWLGPPGCAERWACFSWEDQ